jgi:hypothetical protein
LIVAFQSHAASHSAFLVLSSPEVISGLDIDNASFEILLGFGWALSWYPIVWQAGFMEDVNNTIARRILRCSPVGASSLASALAKPRE